MGKDPIETKLSECTRLLSDDPELLQENRTELRSHLLAARDALTSEGTSQAEAAETACRQFGDSEEVAQALLQADFPRLKLRSKIRLFIRLFSKFGGQKTVRVSGRKSVLKPIEK